MLQTRVIYHDTDSVMFTSKPGQDNPKLGEFIGELSNELATNEEPDAYITKFVSCGSKNYCYEIFYPNSQERKYVCKVKGLSLNFSTSNIVNFNSMKQLIDNYIENYCIADRGEGESYKNIKVLNVPQKQIRVDSFLDIYTKNIKNIGLFMIKGE